MNSLVAGGEEQMLWEMLLSLFHFTSIGQGRGSGETLLLSATEWGIHSFSAHVLVVLVEVE